MIKSSIKFFTVIILTAVSINVYSQGVNFERKLSWSQLLEKAKQENKYIMMDVMATWCGPCKQMERTVFLQKEVADALHDKFIAVRVQADETEEDAEYIKRRRADTKMLLAAYKVNAFPTILFFSPQGKVVHRVVGASGVKEFLQEVSIATNPEAQYPSLVRKFNEGEREVRFVDNLFRSAWFEEHDDSMVYRISNHFVSSLSDTALYRKDNFDLLSFMVDCSQSPDRGFQFKSLQEKFEKLKRAYHAGSRGPGMSMSLAYASRWMKDSALERNVVHVYISSLKGNERLDKSNIEFIKQSTSLLSDAGFDILYKNRKRINRLMGDHYVEDVICRIIHNAEIRPLLDRGGEINWDSLKKAMIGKYQEVGEEEVARSRFYHAIKGEFKEVMPNAIQEAIAYFSRYGRYDVHRMNFVAWYFFQYRTDISELKIALEWARTVIKHEPTTNYYDTYANLLYKLGRREEAIKAMEKGFTLPDGNGDMEEIKGNYEKMKKGLTTWPLN